MEQIEGNTMEQKDELMMKKLSELLYGNLRNRLTHFCDANTSRSVLKHWHYNQDWELWEVLKSTLDLSTKQINEIETLYYKAMLKGGY